MCAEWKKCLLMDCFTGRPRVLLIPCLGKVSQWKMHAQEALGLKSMGGMLVNAVVCVKTASCQAACSTAGPESRGLWSRNPLRQL